jgi:hypothetical protein
MQESVPVSAGEARPMEPFVAPALERDPDDPLSDPRALQILSTEHWSLLAGRSLAYNEAFSRAGMFLTFLSASLIVIGFLVGAQAMSSAVVPVALVLLLADLYIGLATLGRLIGASGEELHCVRGMNRIRHAYRDMVPGLEPYFVSSFHDDTLGVLTSYGPDPGSTGILSNLMHGVTTTVGMVATIDCMIVGSLVALVTVGLGGGLSVALPLAVVAFIVTFAVFARMGMRTAIGRQARAESRFPTPPVRPD